MGGVYGSWLGLILVILVLVAQFYVGTSRPLPFSSRLRAGKLTFFAFTPSPSLSSDLAIRSISPLLLSPSIAIWPLGGRSDDPGQAAQDFFLVYLGASRVSGSSSCERVADLLPLPSLPPFVSSAFSSMSSLRTASLSSAAPVLLFFWLCGYIKNRTLPKKVHEIDIDTGRKSWLTAEEMNMYRAERRNAPFLVRTYRMLFTN